MGDRWGPGGPPPEAYSRVTDPQRYAPVVAAVDPLVQALVASCEVTVDPAPALPPAHRDVVRAVRLVPHAGAPLLLATTPFPGVLGWAGAWTGPAAFPSCGCDACDETAGEALDALHEWVAAVVGGGFTEELVRRPRRLHTSTRTASGTAGGTARLEREAYRRLAALAPPGRRHWPPWPLRESGTPGTA